MDIYNYDQNGIYVSTTKAKVDPLEFGRWLIPRNATTVAPPALENYQTAVWTGSEWIVSPDYRGVTYYIPPSQTAYAITSIGVEPPDGAVFEKPPEPEQTPAEIAEQERVSGILSARESSAFHGVSVGDAITAITNQIDSAKSVDDLKTNIKGLLFELVPFLLQ